MRSATHRVIGIALTATIGVFQGCKPAAPPPAQAAAPEVSVMTIVPATLPLRYEYVGLTEPSQTVEIRSRVQGFLFKRAFEEGKKVNAGDLLFQIDPRSFEADLEIALSRVQQTQAVYERTHRDLDRYKELFAKGAATQKELDDAITSETEARASLRLAKADASKSELDLSYTSILSPFDGVIGKSLKDVGSLVDTGSNSLLATAYQTDPIYASFSISERDVLQWKADLASGKIRLPGDQKIRVGLILVDGTRYDKEGRINFVDVKTDPSTGTARLRAELPNAESRLQPGQFVRAELLGAERPDAIAIPQRAVTQTPNGAIVFVVGEGDKAEVRPLKLGPWSGDMWIVEEGLKAGERVIVDGIVRVQPGMPVKATPATPRAPGALGADRSAAAKPAETKPAETKAPEPKTPATK